MNSPGALRNIRMMHLLERIAQVTARVRQASQLLRRVK